MTNKELLERCAKVMRKKVLFDRAFASYRDVTGADPAMNFLAFPLWNPLTSVADAADMAIKMKVDVIWFSSSVRAADFKATYHADFIDHPTEQAAYCYAVCSVVAQMGGE